LADKFKNIANMIKAKFFSVNKLGKVIRAQKVSLPIGFNKNIVYKLNCNGNATYIGQTKKRLNTKELQKRHK